MRLHGPKPFSDSALWSLNRAWYLRRGPRAWDAVPQYATTSAWHGRLLANLVEAHQRDLDGAPLTIIEVGGGTGRLAFRFLRALEQLAPHTRWRYVLTDLVEDNVRVAAEHPMLAEAREAGRLVCRAWDLDDPAPPVPIDGPVVLIGNYLLDTVGQDAFAVEDDVDALWAAADIADEAPDDPTRVTLSWSRQPLGESPWRPLLEQYRGRVCGVVTVPTAGIALLERALGWSEQALFLLADKGAHRLEDLAGPSWTDFQAHGSVSMSVNFHAVAWWSQQRGGLPLLADHAGAGLDLVGLVHGSPSRALAGAFAQWATLDTGSFLSTRQMVDKVTGFTRRQALAWLRLCDHEPRAFAHLAPILESLALDDILSGEALSEVLEQVEASAYLPEYDLDAAVAQLWLRAGRPERAVYAAERSLERYPEAAKSWHLLAVAFDILEQPDLASAAANNALGLDPDLDVSSRLLARIAQDLA